MSSLRLTASVLLRTSKIAFSGSPRVLSAIREVPARNTTSSFKPSLIRLYASKTPKSSQSKFYSFAEVHSPCYTLFDYPSNSVQMQNLSKNPKSSLTLIDTREPSEVRNTGTIPTSVNIPVSSSPDAFFISPEEFEERFGFERPEKGDEVVFYCKAGVRSRAAAELARQNGWEFVSEYPGSWMDWEKNNGATEGGKS